MAQLKNAKWLAPDISCPCPIITRKFNVSPTGGAVIKSWFD